MFSMSDFDDDLFNQPKITIETLHSESDLHGDIFAPATTADRTRKFNPNRRINKIRNPPKLSKSSASEDPPSTSKFHDAADNEDVEKFQSEVQAMTETARANYEYSELDSLPQHDESLDVHCLSFPADGPIESLEIKASSSFPAYSSEERECCAPMFPLPDLGADLFHQPKITTETLHLETNLRDDIFAPAAIVDRTRKFNPNRRINNNKNSLNLSISSAPKDPPSTSKFHDVADADEHVEKIQSEVQAMTKTARANCEYSQLDLLPLHNESLDVHGLSFHEDVPIKSLQIKACNSFLPCSSEERASCGNINDLKTQPLIENEDLHTTESDPTINHIEESNLDECAPSIVQNDGAEKLSREVRQGDKELESNVDNMANTTQNAKNTISEMDVDYGGNGDKDDDISKQKKRKLPKKSRNRSCEHDNSIKSSNKVSEEPASTVKDPPNKRLRHGSSRCKSAKRRVNKALLEIPDDELGRRQLVIRDLIRLADFKERILNKEAAALKSSFSNQSKPNNPEHEQEFNGDDANEEIQHEVLRLNYHSHMRRPLQTRWSKTDTEFFYQAIRQFGTDFAMIQVLFPNRSRQQVKAKFKNEQRKHPMQISDALVHRSKDNSHFEKVIEHLQAVAEQKAIEQQQALAEQNSKSDATDPTAESQDEAEQNEEEESLQTNLKEEEEDVKCSVDWDGDSHTPTKFSASKYDFDQHSEAYF